MKEYKFELMAPLWENYCISDFLLASRGPRVNKPAITSRPCTIVLAAAPGLQFCFVKEAAQYGVCLTSQEDKDLHKLYISVQPRTIVIPVGGQRERGFKQTVPPNSFDIETSDKQKIQPLIYHEESLGHHHHGSTNVFIDESKEK